LPAPLTDPHINIQLVKAIVADSHGTPVCHAVNPRSLTVDSEKWLYRRIINNAVIRIGINLFDFGVFLHAARLAFLLHAKGLTTTLQPRGNCNRKQPAVSR